MLVLPGLRYNLDHNLSSGMCLWEQTLVNMRDVYNAGYQFVENT